MVSKRLKLESARQPYKKAGVVIHGRNAKNEHALIAPYTQGRFYDEDAEAMTGTHANGQIDDRTKYYALPKGTIDKGEIVWDAALRETKEETGIDVQRLLGKDGIKRLRNGETLRGFPSPGYPGVTIRRADPNPVDHTYHTRASTTARPFTSRMALFNIEVDTLAPLAPYLKNPANCDAPAASGEKRQAQVQQTTSAVTADRNQYPDFDVFLQWLRAGAIPPDGFNGRHQQQADRDPRHRDQYQLLCGDAAGSFTPQAPAQQTWFANLERQFAPSGTVASRTDWQQCCRDMPAADFKKLVQATQRIKHYLTGRNCLAGDEGIIKLDDKDSPLFYYQEGADIVSFERFIGHSLKLMRINHDYGRAMGGNCQTLADESWGERLSQSQFGAIAAFATPRDINRGIARFVRDASEFEPIMKWQSVVHGKKFIPDAINPEEALLALHQRFQAQSPLGSWAARAFTPPSANSSSLGA